MTLQKKEEINNINSNSKHSFYLPSVQFPNETPPTQAHIDIIRFTWERISDIRLNTDNPTVSAHQAFGLEFYKALFELDPTLKLVFSNIVIQARALAGMISFIVRLEPHLSIREANAIRRKEFQSDNFSHLIKLISQQKQLPLKDFHLKIRALGMRHYQYQMKDHHLSFITTAILTALKYRLGDEFIPEIADAWSRVYSYVIYHMFIGLRDQENSINQQNSTLSNDPNRYCTIQ